MASSLGKIEYGHYFQKFSHTDSSAWLRSRKPKELIMNKQCQRVHDYMVKNGSISPIEAFLYLGVTKLATRISEMRRHDGIDVVKVPFVGMNRFGEKVRYMKYYLPELSSEKKEA